MKNSKRDEAFFYQRLKEGLLKKALYIKQQRSACCRVDIVAKDPHTNNVIAIEIKSDCDTFARLDTQLRSYYKVFTYVILSISKKNLQRAKTLLAKYPGLGIHFTR